MRLNSLIPVCVCLAFVAVTVSPGQSQQPRRGSAIAVVNMPLIFEQARMVQDLEASFRQEKARIQSEAEARGERVRVLQRELESGAFAKSSPDYEERLTSAERLKMELEHYVRTQDRRLLRRHKEWFERIYRRVTQATAHIAQAEGVDMVLSSMEVDFDVAESRALVSQILQKQVIYASPRVDVTPQVLERVNDEWRRNGGVTQIKLAK